MTDTARTVTYTDSARHEMQALPTEVRAHLAWIIRCKAQQPHLNMVVSGWTCDLPDHIYRAIKDYRYPPGYRIIFHVESRTSVVIVRVARRDNDPYCDGH